MQLPKPTGKNRPLRRNRRNAKRLRRFGSFANVTNSVAMSQRMKISSKGKERMPVSSKENSSKENSRKLLTGVPTRILSGFRSSLPRLRSNRRKKPAGLKRSGNSTPVWIRLIGRNGTGRSSSGLLSFRENVNVNVNAPAKRPNAA